ncbi:MAG: transposase [SAR202 cluster bacterium]|jgi:transposase|nr:transposase [SAR202 cluster bacterium]MQG70658.1 transposase [SAR202 cluster bacterium]|tara:strand:+ start:1183 stop:2568 length:1386 start_codon:yes stop_codon:yes gene_type:complete
MNDQYRPPLSVSPQALMRYSILAQLEALLLSGSSPNDAVSKIAGQEHAYPDGRPVRVSVRTLQRWRSAYASGGIEALVPRSRKRTETSMTLSEALVAFFRDEKHHDPRASVPELLRRARVRGIIAEDLPVDRSTAWRACRRMGLPTRARPSKREGDMRRWRYPHRMQCVLADGKHFRAGGARLRRVALFFLDDATRYGLDGIVGTSESVELFLHGLYGMVGKHGLMDLLYLDKGPGFRSNDTLAVVQGGLRAWLIHGTTRYPQGHGAIERFHRTADEQLLRSLDGNLEVDPDCHALTLRLRHFLDRYNDTPHETFAGDTPRQRWEAGRPLRFPEDQADLYRRFVVREPRKVSADHVIKADGRLWEAPRGLGGTWAEVTRHLLDGRYWVLHEGRMVQLAELDVHANATGHRGYIGDDQPVSPEGIPATAARLAFDHDLRPLVDSEGGFRDEKCDEKNEETNL